MRKTLLLGFPLLFSVSLLFGQATKLSNNTNLSGIVLNGKPIFISDKGGGLYTTDGTAAGTKIFTSAVVSDTTAVSSGALLNNKLYFTGISPAGGSELWVTDATAGGTSLVKDIVAGTGSSTPNNMVSLSGFILFFASTPQTGNELYRTDGTSGGTSLVKDIYPGSTGSLDSTGNLEYAVLNNVLYFFADNGDGPELWRSDGTSGGTYLVKNITTNVTNGSSVLLNTMLVNGSAIYFSASDGTNGEELWKSDGTANGTVMVKDLLTGAQGSSPSFFTLLNGKVVFSANTDPTSFFASELWVTDGTSSGTVQLAGPKLASGGGAGVTAAYLFNATIINNQLLFSGTSDATGNELYITDGTAQNTKLLVDINPTAGASSTPIFFKHYDPLGSVTALWNGKAYFAADNGSTGTELWQTDGTAAGTTLLKDIFPGSGSGLANSSYNIYFTQNTFFFVASPSDAIGYEVFRSDGTADGTGLVEDINKTSIDPNINFDFVYNSQLYFTEDDGDNDNGDYDLFVVDQNVTGLPVTLVNFTGALQPSKMVQLHWQTQSESNSSRFEIERSINGQQFTKLNQVAAAGNSASLKNYSYLDESTAHLTSSLLYYRLKMVDLDGSFKYSGVLPIHILQDGFTFMVSPNPVKDQLYVTLNTNGAANSALRIVDAGGRSLYAKKIASGPQVSQEVISTSSFQSGIYYIQLVTDNKVTTKKFVKR